MFFNVLFVSANITEPVKAKALTNQIYNLLGEEEIPNEIRGQKAEVRLEVDNKGRIRILTVDTESKMLSDYIKENVHFKVISKGSYEEGMVYRVPIEVVE